MAIGFLLLVSLAVSAALAALNTWLSSLSPANTALWAIINAVVSMAVTTGVLLLWAYYSCQIVLFGAEFTRVWDARHGVTPKPESFAVKESQGAQLLAYAILAILRICEDDERIVVERNSRNCRSVDSTKVLPPPKSACRNKQR